MKVIIAEKPSLGRTIATAISKSQNTKALNNKGYITVGNYIVTYAYGHLLTLQDMDSYFGKKIKWNENLPFYPNPFKFQLKKDKGVKDQFNLIRTLINDNKIDEIICAGDADREGEVIVRLILHFGLRIDQNASLDFGCQIKQIKRLLHSSTNVRLIQNTIIYTTKVLHVCM